MGQTVLRWEPTKGFGSFRHGIFGFLKQWVDSRGGYFYCDPFSIKLSVHGGGTDRLGDAEVPADIGIAIAMRDALVDLVKQLEKIADSAALTFINENPGKGSVQLSRIWEDPAWQARFEYLERLDDQALKNACQRLKAAGLVEYRYEKESLDDGKPLFSLYLTTQGDDQAKSQANS